MINESASHGEWTPVAATVGEQAPMLPKTAEPVSAQPLPPLPSAQGSEQSLPFHIAIADNGLEITARIKKEGDAENLIQILQTIKPLLQNIYGQEPTALGDPPDPLDPPDIGDHAEGVFEASMTPHNEAETGISFFITKAQKAELRGRGFTEEQIREMKPQDAHRALGLIS